MNQKQLCCSYHLSSVAKKSVLISEICGLKIKRLGYKEAANGSSGVYKSAAYVINCAKRGYCLL